MTTEESGLSVARMMRNNTKQNKKEIVDDKEIQKSDDEIITPDWIFPGPILLEGFGDVVVKVNPFIVEIDPPIISAGDTARIIPKYMDESGNYVEYPANQTFELGMLDGCALGKLSNAGIDTNYLYGITQPIYFIADTNAGSGVVKVRVGLIEITEGNRSTKGRKTTESGEYCFLNTFQAEMYKDAEILVGNECGAGAPTCNGISQAPLGFKEEVIEVTGDYIFNKEGFYPKTLKPNSAGLIRFLNDGEFKIIPVTKPPNDPINAVPLSGAFYSPYEIETCFNKNLNNGSGAYQYSFKSVGESDNYIHKPIIIQVDDYSDDPYEMKTINDLETIPLDKICKALIDFEYNRYRASESADNFFVNVLYGIVDVYWEHEKYHKRDAIRFLNEKFNTQLIRVNKTDGSISSKTLKNHLQSTFSCSQQIKNFDDAKREGEKYINNALIEFSTFFKKNWYGKIEWIYFNGSWKPYILQELYAHWSDSVQGKITYYQSILTSRNEFKPDQCNYNFKELWEPFNKYRNNR